MNRANKYLTTPSGHFLGTRAAATLLFIVPMLLAPVLGAAGVLLGVMLDVVALGVLSALVAFVVFTAVVIAQWAFILGSGGQLTRATELWMAGDTRSAVALCHKPLARVFRADVRTRALHVLGLCAEANGDFAEAEDLFAGAVEMIPAMVASKWKRHARVLMLSRRAIALVALGRVDEADALARQASAIFPPAPPGGLDFITDDASFGAVGVAAALRDLEPGRDPRAVLTLACATVLTRRGAAKEALELIDRERWLLDRGLSPRERALIARVERHARGRLEGGPLRAAAMVPAPAPHDPASEAWVDRVLPRTS
jgi:tetratricopeptide (TPR) repeat protein